MKYIWTFLLLISTHLMLAQTMYLDSIYSVVNKTTHDFKTYQDETLQFDFYVAENAGGPLPLLVYVHGGGFFGLSRDFGSIPAFAAKLARRGYAVASVSHRLTMKDTKYGCEVEASLKMAAIDSAAQDVTRAVRQMIDHQKELRIDPNKIILAGSSTGAYTVLNMAYVHKGKTLPPEFNYAGVISMAGALTTLANVDASTAIPTQLFHGTGDVLVPYEIGPHAYCRSDDAGYFLFYGSAAIARRLKGLGAPYYLYTANGGSHSWAIKPMNTSFHVVMDFLYHDIMSNEPPRQTEQTINEL